MTLEVSCIIHFSKITLTILTKPVRNISNRPKTLYPMYYKQVVDIRPKNNFERERVCEIDTHVLASDAEHKRNGN